MKKPFKSEFFCYNVFMFGLLVIDGPFLSAANHGYRGEWFPVIISMGIIGAMGVVGTFGWLSWQIFYEMLRAWEKKLISQGTEIHSGWGLLAGLIIAFGVLICGMTTFMTLLIEGGPHWQLLMVFAGTELGLCFALALIRLHNLMGIAKGTVAFMM